jgi:alanine racemase
MSALVWVELDAGAVEHNVRELKRGLDPSVSFCAVVKANAYGHGVREMAGLLPGADWLAVNSCDEARELHDLGISLPVLILGYVPLGQIEESVRLGFRLTVYNRQTVDRLHDLPAGLPAARVHVKVETGTGRQGVMPEELEDLLGAIASGPGVVLEGLSTHFANIEDTMDHDYAAAQLERFRAALALLEARGIPVPCVHTAATAAFILFPKTHFTMVRAGIGLYGLWPSRETYLSALLEKRPVPDLRPVLTWKTRIAQIKLLAEGSSVSYGCTFKTTRATKVAVLPVGYADGYDRGLGNVAYVLVRGKRAQIVGRVCMNMVMADVTDVPGVSLEDEVVLLGSAGAEVISAETMAGWVGSINYEIVSRISPLLPRKVVR